MLRQLRLKNFKGWRDTAPVRMAPLTIFFGTNSSGKSSIEQFLLMLKQTVNSSDRKMVLYPGDANTPVNLGSFTDLIYGHDVRNKLEFSLLWELTPPLEVSDRRSNLNVSGDQLEFSASISGGNAKYPYPFLYDFRYRLLMNAAEEMRVGIERNEAPAGVQYDLKASPYKLVRHKMRAWSLGFPRKFYGFPDEVSVYYQNADFVQDFSLEMERLLQSISHIGPLRSKAERLYSWSGGEPEDVGYAGEKTIGALLAAKGRRLGAGKGKRSKSLQELVAAKLQQLELIDAFDVKEISKNRNEFEVKVKTGGSASWVDLPDVGFGVSQVLPVIVQCYYAQPRSILFIEQPELHLHPRAQAHLADLFIDVLSSRENGEARNIQLIVETHSEHFLHRLQRRIAESSSEHPIVSSQVAGYFARHADGESRLDPLQFDAYGAICNWPTNFFGDTMGDLREMSKAGVLRRSAQRPQGAGTGP